MQRCLSHFSTRYAAAVLLSCRPAVLQQQQQARFASSKIAADMQALKSDIDIEAIARTVAKEETKPAPPAAKAKGQSAAKKQSSSTSVKSSKPAASASAAPKKKNGSPVNFENVLKKVLKSSSSAEQQQAAKGGAQTSDGIDTLLSQLPGKKAAKNAPAASKPASDDIDGLLAKLGTTTTKKASTSKTSKGGKGKRGKAVAVTSKSNKKAMKKKAAGGSKPPPATAPASSPAKFHKKAANTVGSDSAAASAIAAISAMVPALKGPIAEIKPVREGALGHCCLVAANFVVILLDDPIPPPYKSITGDKLVVGHLPEGADFSVSSRIKCDLMVNPLHQHYVGSGHLFAVNVTQVK